MRADLAAQVELDLVRAVLADPGVFRAVQGVTPSMLANPIARAIWTVVAAHQGNTPASVLYDELDTFEEGRKVHAIYPTLDQFRILWSEGRTVGDPVVIADAVRDAYVGRAGEEELLHLDMTLPPVERFLELARRLQRVASVTSTSPINDLAGLGDDIYERFLWRQANPNSCIGWKCGDPVYDKFLQTCGGLDGERVINTGALTSHGKSTWLISQALGFATTPRDDNGKIPKVLYISTEMGERAIAERVISWFSRMDMRNTGTRDPNAAKKVLEGNKRWQELVGSKQFDIFGHTQVDLIAREVTKRRDQDMVDILVIDYLGRLQGSRSGDRANSYQMVGAVSNAVQALARELKLPVISAFQLNRATRDNPGGKPDLNNMSDSSVIGHDANVVHLLWRPDIVSKGIVGASAGIWTNVAVLLTEKNREGPTMAPAYYHINAATTRFEPVPEDLRRQLKSEEEQRKVLGR